MARHPTSQASSQHRELSDLSPTEFENLIYDLMIAKGMINVVWRTPGADGGRDIEAESVERDASGAQGFSKWYVECKRYGTSVDWPTIHPKLAYADAAEAEYLLLCTNSKFTPQAVNCSNQWNTRHRYPKIRLWAGHDITANLAQFPDLQYRYGLISAQSSPGRSIVALSLALSKSIGTYYSSVATPDQPSNRMLQAAFAIALLLQVRMEDIETRGAITRRTLVGTDDLSIDADFVGTPQGVDEPALVAFCSYMCALTRRRLAVTFTDQNKYTLTGCCGFSDIFSRYRETFSSIALWGDLEFTFTDTEIKVVQR